MIYLDYAAATPVDQEVLSRYIEVTNKYFANPNSSHQLGQNANHLIIASTKKIASYLNIEPEEIIYTSGASESNNLAIKGIAERYKNFGKHILISSLEHNSIVSSATRLQEQGFEVELLPITKEGLIDLAILKNKIREDTILVSICTVDSEIGLKQPIEKIGEILKQYPNCHFHTDATQAIGKIPVDLQNVDLLTFAPHKFYGLPGIGVLIKKKNISLHPQIDGGKSTTIYRSGTPETANIAALEKALSLSINAMQERYQIVEKLYQQLKQKLATYPKVAMNNTTNSIPYTLNFSIEGIKSTDIQKKLEENDIYVSTKTSCCPIMTPSKLVYALTKDKNKASSSIRVSLSHLTTQQEIEIFISTFDKIYQKGEQNGKI
ncbi:MAG: cysteine desulfurase family protein [Bacilli bacterium]|nr:cysteine desulfurase family protein [Bacilli bacterium]